MREILGSVSPEKTGKIWMLLARALRMARRTSVVSLADQAVVSSTNFLTGVIMGRVCSREEFGLYMLGLSIILLANEFQTSLIATSYMVHSPKLKEFALTVYTGSAVMHQWALTGCMLLVLGIGWLSGVFGFGPDGLETVISSLGLTLGFILFREFIRKVCFARMNMSSALKIDVMASMLQMGMLIAFAACGILTAAVAFQAAGFACLAAGFVWLWSWRDRYSMQPSKFAADFAASWSLGKWVFASGALWTVSMNVYPWLLASFHGAAAAGVWGACLGTVALANPALAGIQNYLGPKISVTLVEYGVGTLRRLAIRMNVIVMALMTVFSLGMFFWGGRLVVFMYGAKYSGAGMVVSILAVGTAFSTGGFIFSRTLFAMNRADIDFYVNFSALIVLMAAGIPMVFAWGPLGAALGMVCAHLISTGLRAIAVFTLMRARGNGSAP